MADARSTDTTLNPTLSASSNSSSAPPNPITFSPEDTSAPSKKRDLEEEDVDSDGNVRDRRSGRRKIKIEYIEDKSRRHITFSKRKAGIMKKAYELATLTGTQVLLLVVSETGLVYTFTTPKLQPLVTKSEGKNLIQACLNAPETAEGFTPVLAQNIVNTMEAHGYATQHFEEQQQQAQQQQQQSSQGQKQQAMPMNAYGGLYAQHPGYQGGFATNLGMMPGALEQHQHQQQHNQQQQQQSVLTMQHLAPFPQFQLQQSGMPHSFITSPTTNQATIAALNNSDYWPSVSNQQHMLPNGLQLLGHQMAMPGMVQNQQGMNLVPVMLSNLEDDLKDKEEDKHE